jgi:hypothetical protein
VPGKTGLNADRFPILRQRLLILLSIAVTVIGIALIISSTFLKGTWRDGLLGIGVAIFATGPITIMVWWVTDDLYRGELSATIRAEIGEALDRSTTSMSALITESTSATLAFLREANTIVQDSQALGISRVHLTRVDALNRFSKHMLDEIDRAHHGHPSRLWFVCTDLKGFLDPETDNFNPQELIRSAAAAPTLDMRILMADPEYTAARSETSGTSTELRQRSQAMVNRLRGEYGVQESAIRFYSFRPTVFAIATTSHMLLNPYPLEGEGHRCMSVVVNRTSAADADGHARDIYHQYLRSHFDATWAAATARGIDDLPPLVSRISLSKDQAAANSLLTQEIADHAPRQADLIEYSADTVRALLVELAEGGTKVRLLMKHPDSVSRAQRDKIISNYWYLRDRVFGNKQDGLEVRFYRTAATLRGRRFDGRLINVGWYTPDISSDGHISDWEIVGHVNPTVTADLDTAEGKALDRMFGATFDGLWHSSAGAEEVDRYLSRRDGRNADAGPGAPGG